MIIFLIISLLLSILLALPPVQTALAKYFTNQINEDTGVHLQVDKLQITISGRIILKDFMAYDEQNDTIFYGKRLQTYIRNPWNIKKENVLKFGKTSIEQLRGKIIYYKGQKKSNLDVFIDKVDGKPSSKSNKPPFAINIQKLILTDSRFKYLDYNVAEPLILDFNKLNAEIDQFVQKGDLVAFKAKNIQLVNKNGLQVEQLKTDFEYSDKAIKLLNLGLKTPLSHLTADLTFNSPDKGYSDFNNRIKIIGQIKEAKIATNDLNKFSNTFESDKYFSLQTLLNGTLNNLKLNNFKATTSTKIFARGTLVLENIFDKQHYTIKGDFKQLKLTAKSLKQLMPNILSPDVYQKISSLGQTDIQGKISYGNQNFDSDIEAITDLGQIAVKLSMSDLNRISKTKYRGYIRTKNFKIKDLVNVDFDNLTTDFKLNGTGLNLKSLNAKLEGQINNLFYKGYNYHGVNINGTFQKKLFEGQFDVSDKNLDMDFTGLIDFSKPKRKVDFYAEICKSNLYELKLTTDELVRFTGDIAIKAEGTTIDDVVGNVTINNVNYTNQKGSYQFGKLVIESEIDDESVRNITFKSKDIADGYVKGKFKFKSIPVLTKNAIGSVFANYKITPVEDVQFINYRLDIHNKIVNLLIPGMQISNNTQIKGKINSKDNKLKLRLLSPKISMDEKSLVNVNLRIDNKNPLYNTFLKIDTINAGFYQFKNLRLLNTTINDTLYLKTKFDGGSQFKDKYDIAFFYTMDQWQNFIFGLQKSTLQFKDVPWLIDPNKSLNRIVYNNNKDSLKVDDVKILHQHEMLGVKGLKNKDSLDFEISLDSINLNHITPALKDFKFEGRINGIIRIAKFKKEILPSTVLNIKNFKFNGETLGDVDLKMSALPGNNIFVDLSIKKEDLQGLKLIGYLDLKQKKPKLNATLLLSDFPVNTLQNLFKETFGNLRGKISGSVKLAGPLNDLSFDGKLYLKTLGLKILALNVDYQFNNRTEVYLHGQTFEIKNADFYDIKHQSVGQISGVIKHHNFDNWYLDLNIKTDNLLVLDTPPNPLEMFYGTVFTGGKARIYGYVNHLKIDADMQTKPQTNFVITLNDVETMGDNDFVRIISKNDYKNEQKDHHKKHKIYEGLEMSFDLDITPDAQVQIILDQEFGSKLTAKGEGAMLLQINTNGQFNIWGDFTVLDGIYNFKSFGVIDKKFVVEPGSYISWEADPYNATLDIKAVYETFADPTVILADQGLNAKKMPVDVIIYLKNNLMKPDISFDLELPKANAILKSQVEYILNDPNKKNLQVLSLLSYGNFINENDYNLSKQAGGTLYKTISETGLNILNSIMAQDDKFQVNLNYTRGDDNIERNLITDPQVGLSLVTKINKKVYINGKVAVPVGRYTKSSIVGDVELEVYLDKKGNLVFRVFNKQTELEYIGQQEGYTQGIGVSYQVDFDVFSEILQKLGISVKKDE